jgi:trehalose 6-phosphate phosphatase
MRHIFGIAGKHALASVVSRRPLLAFDFDGTLAPIVSRPHDAQLSLAVAERLRSLSRLLPLAIVTGRARDDVLKRLSFEPSYVVGNHGAEDPLHMVGASARIGALDPLRSVLRSRSSDLDAAGVLIEDKRQSLALHYRLSRHRDKAKALIDELLDSNDPAIRAFPGKMVVNVVPSGAPDKADAVHRLLARSGAECVLFAGDDLNDEPVFASAPSDWLTVRVGRDDPVSRAQFFMDGPHDMAMLLDRILILLNAMNIRAPAVGPAL